MKKKMFRFFLDYEKEEKWVNEMATQGWHLQKNILGYFTFVRGEPGKYIYRTEWTNKKGKDYYEFLETMNIECVSKFGGCAYFRKEAADGEFELYSDAPSKIHYLKSMNNLFIPLALLNTLLFFFNIGTGLTEYPENLSFFGIGLINLVVGLLLWVPISKIQARKKQLKQVLHVYEG